MNRKASTVVLAAAITVGGAMAPAMANEAELESLVAAPVATGTFGEPVPAAAPAADTAPDAAALDVPVDAAEVAPEAVVAVAESALAEVAPLVELPAAEAAVAADVAVESAVPLVEAPVEEVQAVETLDFDPTEFVDAPVVTDSTVIDFSALTEPVAEEPAIDPSTLDGSPVGESPLLGEAPVVEVPADPAPEVVAPIAPVEEVEINPGDMTDELTVPVEEEVVLPVEDSPLGGVIAPTPPAPSVDPAPSVEVPVKDAPVRFEQETDAQVQQIPGAPVFYPEAGSNGAAAESDAAEVPVAAEDAKAPVVDTPAVDAPAESTPSVEAPVQSAPVVVDSNLEGGEQAEDDGEAHVEGPAPVVVPFDDAVDAPDGVAQELPAADTKASKSGDTVKKVVKKEKNQELLADTGAGSEILLTGMLMLAGAGALMLTRTRKN